MEVVRLRATLRSFLSAPVDVIAARSLGKGARPPRSENNNYEFVQIAMHTRHEQGRFSTHAQSIAQEKIRGLERAGARGELSPAQGERGRPIHAEAVVNARGIGTRGLVANQEASLKSPGKSL